MVFEKTLTSETTCSNSFAAGVAAVDKNLKAAGQLIPPIQPRVGTAAKVEDPGPDFPWVAGHDRQQNHHAPIEDSKCAVPVEEDLRKNSGGSLPSLDLLLQEAT